MRMIEHDAKQLACRVPRCARRSPRPILVVTLCSPSGSACLADTLPLGSQSPCGAPPISQPAHAMTEIPNPDRGVLRFILQAVKSSGPAAGISMHCQPPAHSLLRNAGGLGCVKFQRASRLIQRACPLRVGELGVRSPIPARWPRPHGQLFGCPRLGRKRLGPDSMTRRMSRGSPDQSSRIAASVDVALRARTTPRPEVSRAARSRTAGPRAPAPRPTADVKQPDRQHGIVDRLRDRSWSAAAPRSSRFSTGSIQPHSGPRRAQGARELRPRSADR